MRTIMVLAVCGVVGVVSCDRKAPAPAAAPVVAAVEPNAAETYLSVHGSFTAEEHAAIGEGGGDAVVARHGADIERLIEASRSARCDFGVDRTRMDASLAHLGRCRALARLLNADAKRLLAAGDADGAAKRLAAMLRLACHVSPPEGAMVEVLVGVAIARLGADGVVVAPSLAQAASKAELREALGRVLGGGVLNSQASIAAERARMAAIFAGGPAKVTEAVGGLAGMTGENWTNRTPAEVEAAAKKVDAMYAEAGEAWARPGAVTKLRALGERAKAEGVSSFYYSYDKLRQSVDELRTVAGRAQGVVR